MRLSWNLAIALVLVVAGLGNAYSQAASNEVNTPRVTPARVVEGRPTKGHHSLTSDDRLSLLAAALDARVQREAEPDCSHLVHAIYNAAGFPYSYAPSSDLYAGVESFERVKAPLPGDLVVWRGHVGIVIRPSQHIFFSYLSSGPGTDDYEAVYWKRRGHPRFYRYIKK